MNRYRLATPDKITLEYFGVSVTLDKKALGESHSFFEVDLTKQQKMTLLAHITHEIKEL